MVDPCMREVAPTVNDDGGLILFDGRAPRPIPPPSMPHPSLRRLCALSPSPSPCPLRRPIACLPPPLVPPLATLRRSPAISTFTMLHGSTSVGAGHWRHRQRHGS
ncbi:hypothetical protein DAI22_08g191550 [Oryza sativa Japonica Group]|nr:hypothetical protein DAI22_08g191550 [Oryza sativa Japonica Group]